VCVTAEKLSKPTEQVGHMISAWLQSSNSFADCFAWLQNPKTYRYVNETSYRFSEMEAVNGSYLLNYLWKAY